MEVINRQMERIKNEHGGVSIKTVQYCHLECEMATLHFFGESYSRHEYIHEVVDELITFHKSAKKKLEDCADILQKTEKINVSSSFNK